MIVDYKSGNAGGVISLSGEIDHHAAMGAISRINSMLDEHQPGVLFIDLSGVTFMDSSGIALLLNAHRRQLRIGGGIRIVNVQLQPMRVLSSAGIDKIISTERIGV